MIFDAHLSRIYIQYSILYMLYTDKQIKTVVYRKFLSLSYVTQKKTPAEVIIAGRYRVGKKIANGAFGQLRYRYSGIAFLKHLLFSISERLVRASIAGADCFSEMYSS